MGLHEPMLNPEPSNAPPRPPTLKDAEGPFSSVRYRGKLPLTHRLLISRRVWKVSNLLASLWLRLRPYKSLEKLDSLMLESSRKAHTKNTRSGRCRSYLRTTKQGKGEFLFHVRAFNLKFNEAGFGQDDDALKIDYLKNSLNRKLLRY
ncbi:hypothetical protein GGP41_009670 [Bipolaris sorokiniana]|uniref:Uncharacterized protein n=1 Tax=Cochliobolus sativus TaxID=45130 RepID=A0A8H5ZG50_COCSA|nr:hypothetical protein GGP41_009670 [Bipolaris sorokiniana]